jgi:lipopolysaccharide transport system ATP-binding protein
MSAIVVENLSKRYVIGHEAKTDTLRDALTHGVRGWWSRLRRGRLEQEEFWALREVSFRVEPGEVVGIIGRNGAGKSTLLKILSRITEPTSGSARLRGRVASLLEVGTGFHPELTGRENIFLNGAILGMSRAEITRKFDEIVAFAEIDRFLDTPVKRYSSGMYVRLAFAVAAHLEPEILIVDEVLAVGDTAFQKKCLGKMQAVAQGQGRTVLFVSHNLQAIEHLCARTLHLENGRVMALGNTATVVAEYLRRSATPKSSPTARHLADGFRLDALEFTPNPVSTGQSLAFALSLQATRPATIRDLHLILQNSFGQRVAILDLRTVAGAYDCAAGQSIAFAGEIARLPLVPGTYNVGLTLGTASSHVAYDDLFQLDIAAAPARAGLLPHAVQYLGTTLLEYRFSAELSPAPNP